MVKTCYYCNHYQEAIELFGVPCGGHCKLHDYMVMMWSSCKDCDTVNRKEGMCPQSKTCFYVVWEKSCPGTLEEYEKRKCGNPQELFNIPIPTNTPEMNELVLKLADQVNKTEWGKCNQKNCEWCDTGGICLIHSGEHTEPCEDYEPTPRCD